MNQKVTPTAVLLLVTATFLWAGNAVVGRAISEMVPPITLNFIRWSLAFVFLCFFGGKILRKGSPLWRNWREYALLGLLGIGMYNALQYMALQSSTPINVTLVNSSMPIWMLLVGRLFFKASINVKQIIGALLSLLGVSLVLVRGDFTQLHHFRFVIGDIYMVVAVIAWSFYSWLLSRDKHEPEMKENWSMILLAQVTFGMMWAGLFSAGEWALTDWHIDWSWGLVLAMLYVATGPAIISFRFWGMGVERIGPTLAGFFANLMPLFAALLSAVFLGEMPQIYHGVAFILIVGGIIYASRNPS